MLEMDYESRLILRELCMNSRAPASELAGKLKRSRTIVASREEFLEKELGLEYVLEFDERKLGFIYPCVIQVNLKKAVDEKTINDLCNFSPVPQFVATCKGGFDLLIYTTAKSNIEYLRWEYQFRSKLRDSIERWRPSQVVVQRLGFFPLQPITLENSDIPEIPKRLLLELNKDARLSYRELGEKTGMGLAKARYNLNLLEKSGIIKRFTAVIQKPPAKVHIVYFSSYKYQKGFEERCITARKMITSEEKLQPCNNYAYVTELSGHADEVAWASFDDVVEGYDRIAKEEKIFEPDEIRNDSAIVTGIVYGKWPIRSVDVQKVYDSSSWDKPGETPK